MTDIPIQPEVFQAYREKVKAATVTLAYRKIRPGEETLVDILHRLFDAEHLKELYPEQEIALLVYLSLKP